MGASERRSHILNRIEICVIFMCAFAAVPLLFVSQHALGLKRSHHFTLFPWEFGCSVTKPEWKIWWNWDTKTNSSRLRLQRFSCGIWKAIWLLFELLYVRMRKAIRDAVTRGGWGTCVILMSCFQCRDPENSVIISQKSFLHIKIKAKSMWFFFSWTNYSIFFFHWCITCINIYLVLLLFFLFFLGRHLIGKCFWRHFSGHNGLCF